MRMELFFISELTVTEEEKGLGNTETLLVASISFTPVPRGQPMLKGAAFTEDTDVDATLSVAVIRMKQLDEFTEAGTAHW